MFKTEFYPKLSIRPNNRPNRFYAIPFLGGFIKIFLIIPQGVELLILAPLVFFASLINSFYVLWYGKYWDTAYRFILDYIRLFIKIYFFWAGFIDSYPGFSLSTDGKFVLDIQMPKNPNKLFALPLIGGAVRFLILIPYFIYSQILDNGELVAIIASSFPVLFKGKYPQSTYEFIIDAQRVGLGGLFNIMGFSDRYPSFKISLNHKNVKIALIVIGVILFLLNNVSKSWFKYQNY